MNTHAVPLIVALTVALVPAGATAQDQGPQGATPPVPAELVQCARIQPLVDNIIAAATARLESARVSNDPADMRAAVDHLEAALRDIRAQLTPCSAAAAMTDPHAAHTMPGMQQPGNPTAPATQPSKSGADPHAGHAMPMAPATSKTVPTPKPSAPASTPTADPHAGHGMSGSSPAARRAAPAHATAAKPAAGKPALPPAADAHAGHATEQTSEKQMDPVTGLMVDSTTAPKTTYQGQTYYFSSEQSRKEFLDNPAKFAKKPKG
jgi:YHS domain-containing protein